MIRGTVSPAASGRTMSERTNNQKRSLTNFRHGGIHGPYSTKDHVVQMASLSKIKDWIAESSFSTQIRVEEQIFMR